jgi:endonuclease
MELAVPIYSKPTKTLMAEWANSNLVPGAYFSKSQVVDWFKSNYPEIKSNTVEMHVEGMSINNRNRRHYPNIKPGSGHDLFFKEGAGRFRLWEPQVDPAPRYKPDIEASEKAGAFDQADREDAGVDSIEDGDTFAYERDLQNYLSRNLHQLEPGLRLYEDEGLAGVEFNAGGRYIDILAVDANGALVVIELKVSRGYDRVIGQLLRYMGWIEANLADKRSVRGMIVANGINDDLILATNSLSDKVKLFEYSISFSIREKERDPASTKNSV